MACMPSSPRISFKLIVLPLPVKVDKSTSPTMMSGRMNLPFVASFKKIVSIIPADCVGVSRIKNSTVDSLPFTVRGVVIRCT